MPRRSRIFVPACFYHIIARGIDGVKIFAEVSDREQFLSLLGLYLERTGTQCYAWCLMDTHYHLLLRSSEQHLSEMMKPLHSRYAIFYNKRYNRRGYLFQDRFKSVATQDQGYVEEILRYVHLNPVRAGVCRNLNILDSYPWSGHATIMGTQHCPFQDIDPVLKRFGKRKKDAIRRYREYIKEGLTRDSSSIVQKVQRCEDGKRDRSDPALWVIGDPEFVKEKLAHDRRRRLELSRYAREGWSLETVANHVVSQMGVEKECLYRRSRGEGSVCRKVFAYLAHRVFEIPVIDVARFLSVGGSAVSMMLDEGQRIAYNRGITQFD